MDKDYIINAAWNALKNEEEIKRSNYCLAYDKMINVMTGRDFSTSKAKAKKEHTQAKKCYEESIEIRKSFEQLFELI